jgi:hypothetical protein
VTQTLQYEIVVPAWTAGTQVNMDVSGRILRAWIPAIHAGMTKTVFSRCVCERDLMNRFMVIAFFFWLRLCRARQVISFVSSSSTRNLKLGTRN